MTLTGLMHCLSIIYMFFHSTVQLPPTNNQNTASFGSKTQHLGSFLCCISFFPECIVPTQVGIFTSKRGLFERKCVIWCIYLSLNEKNNLFGGKAFLNETHLLESWSSSRHRFWQHLLPTTLWHHEWTFQESPPPFPRTMCLKYMFGHKLNIFTQVAPASHIALWQLQMILVICTTTGQGWTLQAASFKSICTAVSPWK